MTRTGRVLNETPNYDRYRLDQHITAPRRSWHELGLPRTRAPKTQTEVEQLEGRCEHRERPKRRADRKYANVYLDGAKWVFAFQCDNVTHRQSGFITEDDAARGYNDYVCQRGIARKLLSVTTEGAA